VGFHDALEAAAAETAASQVAAAKAEATAATAAQAEVKGLVEAHKGMSEEERAKVRKDSAAIGGGVGAAAAAPVLVVAAPVVPTFSEADVKREAKAAARSAVKALEGPHAEALAAVGREAADAKAQVLVLERVVGEGRGREEELMVQQAETGAVVSSMALRLQYLRALGKLMGFRDVFNF
jgi:hypothetical protein